VYRTHGRSADSLFDSAPGAGRVQGSAAEDSIEFFAAIFPDWRQWIARLACSPIFVQRVRTMAGQVQGTVPTGASYSPGSLAGAQDYDGGVAPATTGHATPEAQSWLLGSDVALRSTITKIFEAFWAGLTTPLETHELVAHQSTDGAMAPPQSPSTTTWPHDASSYMSWDAFVLLFARAATGNSPQHCEAQLRSRLAVASRSLEDINATGHCQFAAAADQVNIDRAQYVTSLHA